MYNDNCVLGFSDPCSQLPFNLQYAFQKYMDVHGINHWNAKIMYEYVVNKMKRENLKSLEMFKGLEVDTWGCLELLKEKSRYGDFSIQCNILVTINLV